MSKWIDIAQRCEKATGPDREIDCLIAVEVGDVPTGYTRHDAFTWICPQPPYMPLTYTPAHFTASLDAITALIERELPSVTGIIPLTSGGEAWLWPKDGSPKGWRCNAATPALALCAAFCRAMNAMKQADGRAVERKNAFENGCGNG